MLAHHADDTTSTRQHELDHTQIRNLSALKYLDHQKVTDDPTLSQRLGGFLYIGAKAHSHIAPPSSEARFLSNRQFVNLAGVSSSAESLVEVDRLRLGP